MKNMKEESRRKQIKINKIKLKMNRIIKNKLRFLKNGKIEFKHILSLEKWKKKK